MTKRMAVVGYTLDPRHAQKQEELWGCELLGKYYTFYELRKRNRHSQYAYVSAKKKLRAAVLDLHEAKKNRADTHCWEDSCLK